MPGFGALRKFFGKTISDAAGYAAGGAVASTLEPELRALTNEAWSRFQSLPPDALTLAMGVAQGQVDEAAARHWAHEHGLSDPAFTALVNIANVGPALGYAFEAWRRGFLTDGEFETALHRTGLESEWYDALKRLRENLLDPADIARGIHRGLIPDPGLLRGTLPSAEGNVPAYPVYPIDALAEAGGHGIDHDRLGVLVGLQGLPMGSHEAAQALFRGVLDHNDYLRAIAEGNTRNEWAEAIREQSRQIPSPTNYVEGRLRGWLDDAAMDAGAARHGMTAEDTHLLFLIHGRPLVHNQVFIGLLRGGVYDGPTGDIPAPFLKSLQESNLRPEWYNLVWAQRYHYPPFFQTVNLLNKRLITADVARDWLTKQAYAPDAIEAVLTAIGGGAAPAADTHVKSATTSLVATIRRRYVNSEITEPQAAAALAGTSLPQATQQELLATWTKERNVNTLAQAPPVA